MPRTTRYQITTRFLVRSGDGPGFGADSAEVDMTVLRLWGSPRCWWSMCSHTCLAQLWSRRVCEQILADLAVLKALMTRIEQQRSPGEDGLHRPPQ